MVFCFTSQWRKCQNFSNQVEKYIEEYALGDKIRDRRINLLPELTKFRDIFIDVVKHACNHAEERRDQKIAYTQS